jgi:hypothetical protein
VEPTAFTGAADVIGEPVRGSPEAIADALRRFREAGFTQVEILTWPPSIGALEALAPAIELVRAD